MCYDIKTSLEKQLRRALLDDDSKSTTEILEKLKIFSEDDITLHHASGFDHPNMIIYKQSDPQTPCIATWGLVPEWTIDAESIWNKTLNARGETLFEKPSFKDSIAQKRCIVFLEGFYEHHHKNGKTFPHFIRLADKEIFAVAGLYTQWENYETNEPLTTFTIVTTQANGLMQKIHNNPKLKEPRMPLILDEKQQEKWLEGKWSDSAEIEAFLAPYNEKDMDAYTVAPLRGKNTVKNNPNASQPKKYSELEVEQLDLF